MLALHGPTAWARAAGPSRSLRELRSDGATTEAR